MTHIRHTTAVVLIGLSAAVLPCIPTRPAQGQPPDADTAAARTPIARKQEIIRDRFRRFQDRMFRLQRQLAQDERDTADRLARALKRCGELGLEDELDHIIRLLDDPSSLADALDTETAWLERVDDVLAILMRRDGDNEHRQRQRERLQRQRDELDALLKQQRTLRDASAGATETARLRRQIRQAIQRLDRLIERQTRATNAAAESDAPNTHDLATQQRRIADDARHLARDVQNLGDLDGPPPDDEPQQQPGASPTATPSPDAPSDVAPRAAQAEPPTRATQPDAANADTANSDPSMSDPRPEPMDRAADALHAAADNAHDAADQLRDDNTDAAKEPQRRAIDQLHRARDALEREQQRLQRRPDDTADLAQQQRDAARRAADLAQRMNGDAAQGEPGASDPQSNQPTPGRHGVEDAARNMRDATEKLEHDRTEDALPHQDRAVEHLEHALDQLEDALQQQRREDREEVLRDLEARFRDMRIRQHAVNDETTQLDRIGADNFQRPEQLRLADLAARQRAIADRAAGCEHILDEEGTTVVFPRVIAQLAQDMTTSARRLADAHVAGLTQTIQREILDTLDQLLEAVKRMQRENEQQQARPAPTDPNAPSPLLPRSAELKLLRASQRRINTRTAAIHAATLAGTTTPEDLARALNTAAERQAECAAIAKALSDADHRPP